MRVNEKAEREAARQPTNAVGTWREPERHPHRPQQIESNLGRALLDGLIDSAAANHNKGRDSSVEAVASNQNRTAEIQITEPKNPSRQPTPSTQPWSKDYHVTQGKDHVSYARDGEEKYVMRARRST